MRNQRCVRLLVALASACDELCFVQWAALHGAISPVVHLPRGKGSVAPQPLAPASGYGRGVTRTDPITRTPTASATSSEHTTMSMWLSGAFRNGMTSIRVRSAPSPLQYAWPPAWSVTIAGNPETSVGVPGWLSSDHPGVPFCQISTSIAPGCNSVSGRPQLIVFGLVVHGGDRD